MRLPLHHLHVALGARFSERAGFDMPRNYGEWKDEHQALRTSVGLSDCSDHGRLRGSGPDVAQVLHGVVTNEVKHLPVGGGCLAVILNDVGRARTLLAILRIDDGFLIETPPALAEKSRDIIDYYIITENAAVEDESAAWGQLTLQGPRARQVLVDLVGEASLPALGDPEYTHTAAELAGAPVRVVRRSRSGEDGYDIWMPTTALEPAWTRLYDAVVAAGGSAVGTQALEVARVEAAIPQFGDDIDDTVIPLETGLMHAISENKGCYLGQEIIARIMNLSKPVRTLVGLLPEVAVKPGDKLVTNGKEVGRVTSAVDSPSLGRPIALGYIRTDLVTRGVSDLTIDGKPTTLQREPFHRGANAPVPVVPPSRTAPRLTGRPQS